MMAGDPMPSNKPSKEQLEKLAEEIKQDQSKTNPAEKRVKLNMPFKKAVKIAQTPPPKKESK
jgi:hypothetical protein